MTAAARRRPAIGPSVRGRARSRRWVFAAGCLGLAALLPFVVGGASGALDQMTLAALYVMTALGLNIVVGFAGLLDLGYVAFFAIGAHVAAHLGSAFWADATGQGGIHVDFLVILVAAVVATTTAGVLIGIPTLRVRGDYIGVITLAFGEIIGQIVSNGREITFLGGSLTGGDAGMAAIDGIDLPFLKRFSPLDLRPWYWFALTLVVLALFVNFRLRDSRLGRAWIALREDEEVAASVGVPIVRTKLLAYGVGAAFGGVSGAFYASYMGSVNPSQFTFSFSILILAMVVLGGVGSIWGVVVGALILSLVNNHLLPHVLDGVPGHLGLGFDLSEIAPGIYGFVLVVVMLVRPRGLVPDRRRRGP
jgi:branched-chain amino acid transport system permease protein